MSKHQNRIASKFSKDEKIVLFEGDTNDLISTLPDNSIKLIVTSPPYNLGKDYEGKQSVAKYLQAQADTIARLYAKLRTDGSLCWQVGNFVQKGEVFPLDILYYPIFKELGLLLRNRIVWHFGHGLHASKRLSGRYETILWFTKGDKYTFNLDPIRVPSKYPGKRHFKGPRKGMLSGNPLGKNPSDLWEIVRRDWENEIWDIPNVKSNHPEKTNHPCQFPVELAERCVLALSNEDDWVFDPYVGVGSTLLASIKHQRRAIGSDKEYTYIQLARERIKSLFDGTLKLRPMERPVHVPSGRDKTSRIPDEWK